MSSSASRTPGFGGAGVLGLRASLGSEWTLNLPHWWMTFVPSVLLVALQEVAAGTADGRLILLSGVAQHVVAGLLGVPVALLLKRRGATLPIWASFLLSGVIGVTRGLLGGGLVLLAGGTADLGYRILFWLAVAWVWMPLTAYVLAQVQHRRLLLAELGAARRRRDSARALAERSSEEIRSRVIWAISATVSPVVDDIRRTLPGLRQGDAEEMQQIGSRLADIADHVNWAVDRLSGHVEPPYLPAPRSEPPLSSALVFELTRPVLWSALAAAALLAVLIPITLDAERDALAAEVLVAVAAAALVLAVVSRAARLHGSARRIRPIVVRYLLAGLAGSVVLLLLAGPGITPFGMLLLLVLPLGLTYSAAVISAAVGVTVANAAVVRSIRRIEDASARLEESARDDEDRARAQLDELLHGPIQGRLAACAMALNFHSAAPDRSTADGTRQMTEAVLGHLDAVVTDLAALERSA